VSCLRPLSDEELYGAFLGAYAAQVVRSGHCQTIQNPSREETLFLDHVISIAGRSITITSHDIFMTGVSLVIGLVFWIAFYFSRKRIVVLKRSSGIDQLTFELSRIADALDRIANRPAERAIAAATRRQLQTPSPHSESLRA
jgi:hypothetical protein